jgi:hypothetical protein
MAGIVTPSARKQLVERVFKFDDEHPKEFQKLKSLVVDHAIAFDEEALRYELGDIVYSYSRRHRGSDYAANIALVEKHAAAAASALSQAHKALLGIDGNHIRLFNWMIATVVPELAQDLQFPKLINETELLAIKAESIGFTARIISSPEAKPDGRSRPTLPYQAPTADLIELWEELTGKPVVTPKGTAKGSKGEREALQPSTEFVRLALKMIDPKVTAANAITSIKKALSARKEAARLPRSDRRGAERVLEIMRRITPSKPTKDPV